MKYRRESLGKPAEGLVKSLDSKEVTGLGNYAAKILGIRKSELTDIYDKLGYSYLDMAMDELDSELETFKWLKSKLRENTFKI